MKGEERVLWFGLKMLLYVSFVGDALKLWYCGWYCAGGRSGWGLYVVSGRDVTIGWFD
jgi:hypothetical protein